MASSEFIFCLFSFPHCSFLFCINFLQQILKYTSKSLIYFQQRLIVSFFSFLFCHNPQRWNKSSVEPIVADRERTASNIRCWLRNYDRIVNANSVECIPVILCCLFSCLLLQVSCFIPNPPGRSLSGGLPTWWWVTQLCSAYTRHVSIHRHGQRLEDKTNFDDERRIPIHVFW